MIAYFLSLMAYNCKRQHTKYIKNKILLPHFRALKLFAFSIRTSCHFSAQLLSISFNSWIFYHVLFLFYFLGDMEGLPTVASVPFEPLVLWTDPCITTDTDLNSEENCEIKVPHKIEVQHILSLLHYTLSLY